MLYGPKTDWERLVKSLIPRATEMALSDIEGPIEWPDIVDQLLMLLMQIGYRIIVPGERFIVGEFIEPDDAALLGDVYKSIARRDQ